MGSRFPASDSTIPRPGCDGMAFGRYRRSEAASRMTLEYLQVSK